MFKSYICTLLIGASAFAGLGDSVDSIQSDGRRLSARRVNADVQKSYTVQELDSDASHIKEYVNSNGVIFAITWQGLSHPDLSVLLGNYYQSYQTEKSSHQKVLGKRHLTVEKENLIVKHFGTMRNIRGIAYDPSLLPTGVSINEIQ